MNDGCDVVEAEMSNWIFFYVDSCSPLSWSQSLSKIVLALQTQDDHCETLI
jgi:hypothetical protein